MSNAVITEQISRALVVRLNKPEIRNPLSICVLERLQAVAESVARDTAICRIVFTGVGDVFASGADLREVALATAENARDFALRGQTLMIAIASLPQKTIAAVNGCCFGGALDLALSCDVRIASPNAQFSHPGANLGIITGWGGTQHLPRLVGEAAALEMFMTAKRVGAYEALSIGLADSVDDDPLAAAIAL